MESVNTLKMYKDLIAAGVSETQAEVQVLTLNSAFEEVATKKDLEHLEIRFNSKLDALNLKVSFVLWFNGIAISSFVGFIVKYIW